MKFVKILFKIVFWVVVVALVALLALPLWFGPVVKGVANVAAPKMLGTGFRIGHLSLNPYTARFELGDFQLHNPVGYSEKFAVTLGTLNFDAETLSLVKDVVHIEEITVKDVFVSYISGGVNNVNNFLQIQYNLAGGKEKYEAAQAEKEAKKAEKTDEPSDDKPSKKVVIDKLELSNIVIQLSGVPIPIRIPSLTFKDIGKDSEGSTLEDVWKTIMEGVIKAAGAVGEQLKALGGFVGDAAAQVTDVAGKAVDGATKAVGDAAKTVGDAVGSVGGGAVGDAAKTVGDAAKTVGDAAKAVGSGAADAVGGAAKVVGDGAKAVGDGASKALDSLKSLW